MPARGDPIAVITPIKHDNTDVERVLRQNGRGGLVRLADRKGPMPTPAWQPVKVKGAPVSSTILQDRDETV